MKVDRLVSIIMVLLAKQRVGARELAAQFEVSPRTIYRDIDAINMAGIPVRAVPGVGGGFEIMEQYKVDKKVFSSADLSAILMGLSSVSGMVGGEEMANALAKVKSVVPAERAKDIALKASQISIDVSPWMGSGNTQSHLEMIKTALQENKLLHFAYADRFGSKTARTAEPYQLVLKGSHWYVQGYCHAREDYRLFKLSRLSNLQMGEGTFTPRDYQKPILDYAENLKAMHTDIQIRIHKSVLDRALDFCDIDNFTPDSGDHYLVAFPFIENDYYYQILLGFGDKCECLGPPHIRNELIRRIQRLAALYD